MYSGMLDKWVCIHYYCCNFMVTVPLFQNSIYLCSVAKFRNMKWDFPVQGKNDSIQLLSVLGDVFPFVLKKASVLQTPKKQIPAASEPSDF